MAAGTLGDVTWLLRDLPRLSAYKLVGKDWTIVFVGSDWGLLQSGHVLFPEQAVARHELRWVALWNLPAQVVRRRAVLWDLEILANRPLPSL